MPKNYVKPSMQEVFQIIDAAVKTDPEVTKGKEGVYQFNIKDEDEGTYQLIIDENGPRAVEGAEQDPQVTLTLKADNFRDLVAGNLNPTAAFMGGKLKIKGNMGLALKLQTVLNSFEF
ncbi:SCP2 sterol-binding domain-containing protein [Virgibacillus sp. MSP4-1]|uniref:SCP2 sterol-binding domain-containing protein n=1 Tax=Virgibacillus sp. MSP4-1 TaxID=2700081 RepID=UPI0003A5679C|nr:SCP2 sterol-binding domain-containing protein [Virgibacillus sp. MSP4-1]QHS22700.1 SCP2 sterol-binding domain-containing protein [Virgibacillus sp. MSP4-1]